MVPRQAQEKHGFRSVARTTAVEVWNYYYDRYYSALFSLYSIGLCFFDIYYLTVVIFLSVYSTLEPLH